MGLCPTLTLCDGGAKLHGAEKMGDRTAISGRDWGLILTLSLLWGGAFFMIAVALRAFPPNTLVLARMGIASVPLLIIVAFSGEKLPRDIATWRRLAILGALNIAIPFMLFIWGQTRVPSGLASILNATTPLWGVLAAHFLTVDEKATPPRVIGVLLGFAGVGTMIGSDALGGFGGSFAGQLACLAATLCYALAAIYARRFGESGLPPLTVATGQVLTSALMMVPIALIVDQPWTLPRPGLAPVVATILLALVSTSFTYVLYFRLLESAGASNSLLPTFLMPIVAILLGSMILDEVLEPKHFAGMALIALGLAAIDGRPLRMLARNANVP